MNTKSSSSLRKLVEYKHWANVITFGTMLNLPEEELVKKRQTSFRNILHTLNHVYVIDDVFKAHLSGAKHKYTARNTSEPAPIGELWRSQQEIDTWYIEHFDSLDNDELNEVIEFEFIGGGTGRMSRGEMFLHVVNHGTYHRGFVSDMCYQIPVIPPANDFTVFLRDSRELANL